MVSLPRLYPGAQNRILFVDAATPAIDVGRLQLCFHTMSGFQLGSESQWKTNGAQGVRSHLGIAGPKDAGKCKDGEIYQWNSLQRQAYAQNNGNPYCISVETSDGAVNGLPWSDAQLDSIVDLIVWFSRLCGRSQPKMATRPGEFGTITYHQQFDTFNTHNHDCPGTVRRGQLTTIAMPRAARVMITGPATSTGGLMADITLDDIRKVVKEEVHNQLGLRVLPDGDTSDLRNLMVRVMQVILTGENNAAFTPDAVKGIAPIAVSAQLAALKDSLQMPELNITAKDIAKEIILQLTSPTESSNG